MLVSIRILRAPAAALFALTLAAGCSGSSPPPASAPESAPAPVAKAAPPAMKMKSELGSVDPGAIKKAFHALEEKFTACQKQGLDRVELLAGPVKFFVRIGEDGAAKWAYLEESEVGDHDTEKCLVDAVLGAPWPKPDGGEAEVRYGMELPLQSARPPTDWPSDKVAPMLGKHGNAIDK
ncbi:MAG: hypothetical protein FWD17_14020, partial [Polyangiaceae bacterium]|nr:hypothetical protein [Polyangiaceae bacterium]